VLWNSLLPRADFAIVSFLDDEFIDRSEADHVSYAVIISNAAIAARKLSEVGLPDSPTKGWIVGSPDEISLWRRWRDERGKNETKGAALRLRESVRVSDAAVDGSISPISKGKGSSPLVWIFFALVATILAVVLSIVRRTRGTT
jgi:hypothetical protein